MEELRRNENTISLSEVVFDGQAEQGVELDYVLPDYYPEIFKILSCRLTPRIMSYSLLGDSKLMLDGSVDIRVLYLAEGDSAINCIEQRYTYQKTVELGKSAIPENGTVSVKLIPKPDYCNCRAVSGRRIDVRGAVSTKIRITADKNRSLPVMPENVQVKTREIECCGSVLSAEKQFTCKEDIETGSAGIAFIMRSNAVPKINEVRVIDDKAIIKGCITVNAAYGVRDEQGNTSIDKMTADIPLSQIIDISGIDDSYKCGTEINIMSCELSCSPDSGVIGCNILAVARVCCRKQRIAEIPCDAFSTKYETEQSVRQMKLLSGCDRTEKTLSVKCVCECGDNEIESVADCSADIYNLSCRYEDGSIILSGLIGCKAVCRNAEGVPCCIEKQEGFECAVPVECDSDIDWIDFSAQYSDADYSIRSDGALEITARIEFCANTASCINVDMVEYVTVNEDKPKSFDSTYALRIYYADGAEDCWSIAKRYNTSVEAIMTENDIEDRDMLLNGMILIPAI